MQLNSCCCMRLNTACMVIGWLGVVVGSINATILSVILANADVWAKNAAIAYRLPEDEAYSIILVYGGFNLCTNVILAMASALLIVGTTLKRHLLFVPWLMKSAATLIFGCLYAGYKVCALMESNSVGLGLLLLIFACIVLSFKFYVFSAVYSFFKQLRVQSDETVRYSVMSTLPVYTKV